MQLAAQVSQPHCDTLRDSMLVRDGSAIEAAPFVPR
jgi:hypothetical protein